MTEDYQHILLDGLPLLGCPFKVAKFLVTSNNMCMTDLLREKVLIMCLSCAFALLPLL